MSRCCPAGRNLEDAVRVDVVVVFVSVIVVVVEVSVRVLVAVTVTVVVLGPTLGVTTVVLRKMPLCEIASNLIADLEIVTSKKPYWSSFPSSRGRPSDVIPPPPPDTSQAAPPTAG